MIRGICRAFASVVYAVRCAAEVQQAMPERNTGVPAENRIELRIGINLGDVIADGDDPYGDGVNIAARIEALADVGSVLVSGTVYDQVRDRLPFGFEDRGEQQVKNIARPIRVYRVLLDQVASVPGRTPLPLPDKPSIAVLPFQNMSSDPEQDFLTDGIAEDIITALSRYPSLFVIARNSCFTYKGRAVEVRQVGHELGVRYILEGSLRKAANRIRVTAQLVETETGNHVWAERYDRELADIFAVQDEISEAATIAIAPAIDYAERQRAMRKPPDSLDAWAAYQRGLWHYSKATPEDNALAQKFCQQAIDLDPTFAGSYVGLVLAQIQTIEFGARGLPESSLETLARRAVALDGADAEARLALAWPLARRGDYEGALAEVERALATAPNLAAAHGALGGTLIHSGRPKEGLAAIEICIRLDPLSQQSAGHANQLVMGSYLCGDYEAAIAAAKRAIRELPEFPSTYRWLAAALGQVGRVEEAKEALEQAIAIAPAAFEMYVRQRVPWHRPQDYERMLDGLRKAGWQG
jgi:adenylate cyclase